MSDKAAQAQKLSLGDRVRFADSELKGLVRKAETRGFVNSLKGLIGRAESAVIDHVFTVIHIEDQGIMWRDGVPVQKIWLEDAHGNGRSTLNSEVELVESSAAA